jgi:hypothetical protein
VQGLDEAPFLYEVGRDVVQLRDAYRRGLPHVLVVG